MTEKEVTEVNTLYFGFDESNHAEKDKKKGEIVVALFSTDQDDSIVREWPNVRRNSDFERWIHHPGHDYRFTILTGEEYKYRSSAANLTEAAQTLVTSVLTEPTSPFSPEIPLNVDSIKIYFDGGGFRKDRKDLLRNYFKDLGLTDVVVDNFIKKNKNNRGKMRKGPRCPRLVYLADILAHPLGGLSGMELLSHPKFAPHIF